MQRPAPYYGATIQANQWYALPPLLMAMPIGAQVINTARRVTAFIILPCPKRGLGVTHSFGLAHFVFAINVKIFKISKIELCKS